VKASTIKLIDDEGNGFTLTIDDEGWATLQLNTSTYGTSSIRLNPAAQNILAAALEGP
jgi:hypothetical protein